MKKLILILILFMVSLGFSQPIGPPMTNERAEDLVGAMLTGVETLISVGYDDVNGLLDFVVDEASIDHDALTNFAANEHIDWTGASVAFKTTLDSTTAFVLEGADTNSVYVVDTTNGRVSLYQRADGGAAGGASDEGLKVFGFDDKSGEYGQLVVGSDGYTTLRASDQLYININGTHVGFFSSTFFAFMNDKRFRFGTSGTDNGLLMFGTAQTADAMMFGLPGGSGDSRTLIFCSGYDVAYDFAHAAQSHPTIFIHSDDQTTDEWLSLTHNATDGVIATGAGDIQLLPATGFVGIGGAPTVALDVTGAAKISTSLSVDTTTLVANATSYEDKVGIGTSSPNAVFHIKANIPGTVGSDPAGQLIIQNPTDTVFSNVAITAYESDGSGNPDQQLWYLGSASGSNSDITFLNRRNSKLSLGTNDTSRITILGNGNIGFGRTDPTAALSMGVGKLIAVDVNAGITADTNQSQGQEPLTAQINEISTVANDGDTVTLPSAVTGIEIEIINNGVNTLQIFPASGDDLGLDPNVSEELEANERVEFVAYDTTNWAKKSSTEIIHAEIHDEDNTDAFVINDAGADFHSYHTNGLASGDLADWTFDAGGAGTSFPIASIADGVDSGTDIEVTTTGNHLLEVGDIISQTNLADVNYVGIFDVKAIISATEYEVAAPYTADGTGTVDQAATLEADAVAAGVYSFAYCISAKPVGANETFDFQLYKEATTVIGSKVRRKFGAGGDYGSMSGCGVVAVADGDKISLAISNENSNANLTVRNLTIVLIRL